MDVEADIKKYGFPQWFKSKEHEFDSCKFGMWLFLVQELMLFGGLFVAFAMYNYLYPETFREAHHHLDKNLGALNTVFLLISSLTMVLGVAYTMRNQMGKAMLNLFLTFLLAGAFMVVKYFEYSHKIHEGLLPGALYSFAANPSTPENPQSLFFSLYFMMTGLHGIHVVGGMVCLLWIMYRIKIGKTTAERFGAVEFVGLYWHLVDLIWIFLFPIFYLVV